MGSRQPTAQHATATGARAAPASGLTDAVATSCLRPVPLPFGTVALRRRHCTAGIPQRRSRWTRCAAVPHAAAAPSREALSCMNLRCATRPQRAPAATPSRRQQAAQRLRDATVVRGAALLLLGICPGCCDGARATQRGRSRRARARAGGTHAGHTAGVRSPRLQARQRGEAAGPVAKRTVQKPSRETQ